MSMIETLPDDIIIDVLISGVLNHSDVLNFSLSCKRFHSLASTNSVWKQLFLFNWSSLIQRNGKLCAIMKEFENKLKVLDDESTFCLWKVLFFRVQQIFLHLNEIFHNHFHEEYLDDEVYENFTTLSKKLSFEFVSAVLLDIILSKNQSLSLTHKYYALKVHCYIHQQWLKPQILELLSENDGIKNQDQLSSFIKGAVIIESWFNPLINLSFRDIDDFISSASKQALNLWKDVYAVDLDIDPHDYLDKEDHTKYLALNKVFFENLEFCGNQGDYFNVKNSFIYHVIASRHGIPIILSIIYREIARRIGFNFECVNNPGHFVLRWQLHELDASRKPTTVDLARAYSYIDVFNNGRLLEYKQLNGLVLRAESATLQEVLHRVALNVDAHSRISDPTSNFDLSVSALNLCLLFEPNNYKTRAKRLNTNLTFNINLSTAVEDNQTIPDEVRSVLSMPPHENITKMIEKKKEKKEKERDSYEPQISLRSSGHNANVNYAVGMVMHHRRYDYICVIRGWDSTCKMSQDWVHQMGVFNMERGVGQPFYHVLVDKDGSQRYAAEDSLEVAHHQEELDHPEIGHYFSASRVGPNSSRHYIPNDELLLRYPEDPRFVADLLRSRSSPLVSGPQP